MHILWINENAAGIGGCERYIAETAGYLRQQGVRSSLLYAVDGQIDPQYTQAFDGAFPMVDLPRQIAEIAPDLLYIHRLSDLAALRTLADSGVPTLRFIHDHKLFCLREHKYTAIGKHTCTRTIGPGCYACLGFINKSNTLTGIRVTSVGSLLNEQQVNRALDAIIVASEYMRDHIVAHGFEPARVAKIPLYAAPLEPGVIQPREEDLLFFAGQLTTGKGVDTLLEALALLRKPARLVIGGTGKFEAEYREQVKRLGLESRVTFAGKLSSDQLVAYYQRATCVVVPSRTPETFGLIGPEAMSQGAPMIATTVGGMGEWLRPGETGLAVPPNDPAALSQAIDRMLGDAEMRTRMGAQGKADYQSRFLPKHHIEPLTRLLCSLVKKGGRN